jgi:septal ring-binding cell division protein DamX
MVAGIVAASVVLVAVIGALGFVLLSGTSTPEIELTEARPRSAPSPADEDDPEDEPTAVPTEEEAEEEEEEEEEDALGEPSSSPSPAPPTPRTTPSPAPARQEPPPTSSGPGGPGSPPWESFVIQVASRPMGTVSWNEVQSEAASAYGYASGELDILESDDYYPAMRPGYWVIFAGPYASRSEAASALSRLSGALPSDAHVRHLDPNCVSPPCS